MKHVQNFGVVLLLNKMKSGAKREWFFCSYRCFLESEKLRCEQKVLSERNFLFTCGILKQFFSFILVQRFGDFVLFLGWFWQWFEGF